MHLHWFLCVWTCGSHGYVIKCFPPWSFTSGNVELPSKHSSGLFVCKILVESDCAQHRWETCAPKKGSSGLDPRDFKSLNEQQGKSTSFLRVYLVTDWLVSKDAGSWHVGLRVRKLLACVVTLPFDFPLLLGWSSSDFVDVLDHGPHWSHLLYQWSLSFCNMDFFFHLVAWIKAESPPVCLAQLRQRSTAVRGQERASVFLSCVLRKALFDSRTAILCVSVQYLQAQDELQWETDFTVLLIKQQWIRRLL